MDDVPTDETRELAKGAGVSSDDLRRFFSALYIEAAPWAFWSGFAACWIYCIFVYGFPWGWVLGWFPAVIAGGATALLWPLCIVGFLVLLLIFLLR